MKLECYAIYPGHEPKLIPADFSREWMDNTHERFAYRCMPLTIANSCGWDILLQERVTATWNGGDKLSDLIVHGEFGETRHALSTFGSGVLTFHVGYIFRTPPGWNLLATGPFNAPKHGIAPLSGIIETDWLSFTFTMNWKMTAPGTVTFEKDEVICRVLPVNPGEMEAIEPVVKDIKSNPKLYEEFQHWYESRNTFNKQLQEKKPEPGKGWQRFYTKGTQSSSDEVQPAHRTKLRLQTPKIELPKKP